MAWVTEINADGQVDYRLVRQAGCGVSDGAGPQDDVGDGGNRTTAHSWEVSADGALVWIGSGLEAVGLSSGTVLDGDGETAARHLMKSCHPKTGARLVSTKTSLRVHEKATLTAAPLLQAFEAKAAEQGVEPVDLLEGRSTQQATLKQQRHMVRRKGEAQRQHVETLHRLARTAGISLADVYGEAELATAWANKDMRVNIRVRGWDLVLDLPKSDSVLAGLMGDLDERAYRALIHRAKDDTVRALEEWIGYAVSRESGELVRLAVGGLLGWSVEHRAARPMGDGEPGDPHLHLHVVIANMGRCEDGKWRSIGSSGRDLYRHASAADAFYKARVRALAHERFGVRRARSVTTAAWEAEGVPEQLRDLFSRRTALVEETAGESATAADRVRISNETRRAKHSANATGMRESWWRRAEDAGVDVDAMLAAAAPGPRGSGDGTTADGPGDAPRLPPAGRLAAVVFDPAAGLTADSKVFTRAQALAAVANALPYGVGGDVHELERLVDEVLRVDGYAVPLPHTGPKAMTSTGRYTTQDVLNAEDVVVAQAEARQGDGSVELSAAQAGAAMGVFEAAAGSELSPEQREVVVRLLTAGNGIEAVIGEAAAGKGVLMGACRIAWDATGTTYAGACPSAVGAKGLQDASAIPSRTVTAWLEEIERGRGLTGVDVLVLDEAVMTDGRSAARLLAEAARTRTQVVAVGDPRQLRAVGVDGWFREVHRVVRGATLQEDRPRRDVAERAAREVWRTGDHRAARELLAGRARVHPAATAQEACAQMLTVWDELRRAWPDELDLLENLVFLAAGNADVDVLNAGAQQIRRAAGELGVEHTYALPGGRALILAENDIVRVHAADYRSRSGQVLDILNGYRATVTAIDEHRRVEITWRAKDSTAGSGTEEASAWMTPDDIACGALSLSYAVTVAAGQGMTCHTSLVYGHGANAFATCPGITRAAEANHLWLPLKAVEGERIRAEPGEACSETELLERSLRAFARFLGQPQPQPDTMVSGEPRAAARPVAVPRQTGHTQVRGAAETALRSARAARARAARTKSPSIEHDRWRDAAHRAELETAWAAPTGGGHEHQEYGTGDKAGGAGGRDLSADRKADPADTVRQRQARAVPSWRQRPHGERTDAQLRSDLDEYLGFAERNDRRAVEAAQEFQALSERLAQEKAGGATRGARLAAQAGAVLEAAGKLLDRARAEADRAQRADARAKAIGERLAAAERAGRSGHVKLMLTGATKRGVRRDIERLEEERIAAEHEHTQAERSSDEARVSAWEALRSSEHADFSDAAGVTPGTLEDLAGKLSVLRTEAPQKARKADLRDLQLLAAANGAVDRAVKGAGRWWAAAARVRAEQQLRETVREEFPELHQQEHRARAALGAEQSCCQGAPVELQAGTGVRPPQRPQNQDRQR